MLTSPTAAGSRSPNAGCNTSETSSGSAPISTSPLVPLDFIIGLRTLPQLKCACRRQFPRDPRRATALFGNLKEAFNRYKGEPISAIPVIYQPFFNDLRRRG